jgi:hypothetical protein
MNNICSDLIKYLKSGDEKNFVLLKQEYSLQDEIGFLRETDSSSSSMQRANSFLFYV